MSQTKIPRQILALFYEYLAHPGNMASVSTQWNAAIEKKLEIMKQQAIMMLRNKKIMKQFFQAVHEGDIDRVREMELMPGIIMVRFQVLEWIRALVMDAATSQIKFHSTLRKRIQDVCQRFPFLDPYKYMPRKDYLNLIRDILTDLLSGVYSTDMVNKIPLVVDCLLKIIQKYHTRRQLSLANLSTPQSAKILKDILSYSKTHRQAGMLSATTVRLHHDLMRQMRRRKVRYEADKPMEPVDDVFMDYFAAMNLQMSPIAPTTIPGSSNKNPWDSEDEEEDM
uniref:Uncharacterized protein n=1 Tax=viral metagenome TaxID=1070528 RepID=A0A6C0K1Y3_9ZZZZ